MLHFINWPSDNLWTRSRDYVCWNNRNGSVRTCQIYLATGYNQSFAVLFISRKAL